MPRNSGGTYSLPAGNPVVTATTISSTWANTTLSDIGTALTDSLSRSGSGAMTASLQLASGTIGAPGLSWSAETTSGLYRAGAGDFRYSISAADVLIIKAGQLLHVDGLVGTPGISFILDPDSGVYRIGANNIGLVVGGTKIVDLTTAGITLTGTFSLTGAITSFANFTGAGGIDSESIRVSTTHPGIVFDDTDAGANTRLWYDQVQGNTRRLGVSTDGGAFQDYLSITRAVGAVSSMAFGNATANPTYSFLGTGVITSGGVHQGANGAVGTPAYSASGDPDTGFYFAVPDQIAIALGGAVAGNISQGTFTGTLTGMTGATTGTVNFQRIGKRVTLWLTATLTGTSNTTAMTMTGLPSVLTPSSDRETLCAVIDNSVSLICYVFINSVNVINFNLFRTGTVANRVDYNAALFTNSGTKGLSSAWTISYTLP